MTDEQLKAVVLPRANVTLTGQDYAVTVEFHFQLDGSDIWYLWGCIENVEDKFCSRELLPQEEISDILEDVIEVDQYCQTEEFREKLEKLALRVAEEPIEPKLEHTQPPLVVELEPYMLQQHAVTPKGKALFLKLAPGSDNTEIPAEFIIKPPENFIPDEIVYESLLQRIYEGVPAIALVGPTGSGKSALAKYVGAKLVEKGWGTFVIDASARLGGDRLFERDDFDPSGTFLLEGFLLKAVRKAKDTNIRLLVVIEEYNTLSDETRREFYRIFTDDNRVYHIQSPQPIMTDDGEEIRDVDFSETCFILTMNPIQERYLTDDVKRLSNAETRRMATVYLGYERDRNKIEKILRAIVTAKPAYKELSGNGNILDDCVSYKLGTDLFLALSDGKDPLGYDVGYSSVADAIWTAALRAHRRERYSIGIEEHILNAIPDPQTRELAAKRIQQATGIVVKIKT
ncbi:hypothetical protein DRQ36_11045 [bacterium]|nr:MAG: hypothetical protein DRQ36_11045 [bacterium]